MDEDKKALDELGTQIKNLIKKGIQEIAEDQLIIPKPSAVVLEDATGCRVEIHSSEELVKVKDMLKSAHKSLKRMKPKPNNKLPGVMAWG